MRGLSKFKKIHIIVGIFQVIQEKKISKKRAPTYAIRGDEAFNPLTFILTCPMTLVCYGKNKKKEMKMERNLGKS